MEQIIDITVIKEKKPSLLDDFKKHLEEKKTRTYTTTNYSSGIYRSGTIIETDNRTVYFYEFSDLTKHPLKFSKVSHFIDWAKEHKIYLSSYTERQLRENEVNYATCYRGSATLMIRASYELLKVAQKTMDYNTPHQHNNSLSGIYNHRDDVYDNWFD